MCIRDSNSVDTSKFLDHYDDRERGEFTEDGWINVLQVGRVTRIKNQLFLTKIAEEFQKRGKKIRILCAGNGDVDYVNAVQAEIRHKGLEQHIKMLGVRDDIDVLMRKSAAFVLPSLYEGMPLVSVSYTHLSKAMWTKSLLFRTPSHMQDRN